MSLVPYCMVVFGGKVFEHSLEFPLLFCFLVSQVLWVNVVCEAHGSGYGEGQFHGLDLVFKI